ncbi:LuxR family transcriptional regulator [Williamsia sp. DF01-3]|uniref:LuxR family transcriptional regulator n=1 Tax=Williamsia sp. DF01-3 TaxID=2934157 RepID=UPI001FF3296A|nr:LuxR family transcriptional regulator [Williamsia sp. DF01-3]MCK0515682.1 LuxR C-terminal-related transcriptional regulator [Williamsia sp. DF01-3]
MDRIVEILEGAEAQNIATIAGNRVEFTHPLLTAGLYSQATPAQRRAVHRNLASIIDQPELRARHLALSAATANPTTLDALDCAAEALSAQGAPMAAGELTDLAIALGGDTPLRRIRAASHHFRAADMLKAQQAIEPALAQSPAGLLRAIAANLLAAVRMYDDSFVEAADLLTSVLGDAADNQAILARTLLSLSMAEGMNGQFESALHHASRAVSVADGSGDHSVLSSALAMWVTLKCAYGHGYDAAAMHRALELEGPGGDAPVPYRPSAVHALMLAWTGQLDQAHTQMAAVRHRCIERGADSDMMWVAGHTILINIWRGRYTEAAEVADDAMERAQQLDGKNMLVIARLLRVMVTAYTGDRNSRAQAREVIDDARRCGSRYLSEWPTMTLGFIEVSLGHYTEAISTLRPLLDNFHIHPGTEILSSGYIPDAVEALVALGRPEEAEPLVYALERNGSTLDRPWMLALGARGRSMLLAAANNIHAAETHAARAMVEHERLPMPFEQARTQLLLGQLQRRQRRKEAAAATLSEALQTFDKLGTPLWAARARTELDRVSIGPRDIAALTPSEQRVADLVATGMTTRAVAAALFISPKTVEVNLTRIYRKLGIRSRAQLSSALAKITTRAP